MTLDLHPASFSVHRSKIADYLLNEEHPVGASKARYFLGFGFRRDDTLGMAAALTRHVLDNGPGIEKVDARSVPVLVVEGPLVTPDGRNPRVRTVWVVGSPDEATFVTAYPCR